MKSRIAWHSQVVPRAVEVPRVVPVSLRGAPAEAKRRERALGGGSVARDGEVVRAAVQEGVVLRAVRAIPRQ